MLKFCPGVGVRSAKYEVNPGSKAAQRGVREGDVISSINGQSTKSVTNSVAHSLLRNAGHTLRLGLNEEHCGSPKRRGYKVSQSADQEQQSLRIEEKASVVRNEDVTVAASDSGSQGPTSVGKGPQQRTMPGGSSKSRRRKRSRANRQKNQGGEKPENSVTLSEKQPDTTSPTEETAGAHQRGTVAESSGFGVQMITGNENYDSSSSVVSLAADATVRDNVEPICVVSMHHDPNSIGVSSENFFVETSCDHSREIVSSYYYTVNDSYRDSCEQSTENLTSVNYSIQQNTSNDRHSRLRVHGTSDEADDFRDNTREICFESKPMSSTVNESEHYKILETKVVSTEMAEKQERKGDSATEHGDERFSHGSSAVEHSVQNELRDLLEEHIVGTDSESKLEEAVIFLSDEEDEAQCDIKRMERHGNDNEFKAEEFCHSEPPGEDGITNCVEETAFCHSETELEPYVSDKKIKCNICEKETSDKHCVCNELKGECPFQNDIKIPQLPVANTKKTDSLLEKESNDSKTAAFEIEQPEVYRSVPEDKPSVNNTFSCEKLLQDDLVIGLNTTGISERTSSFVNESEVQKIVGKKVELPNCPLDETRGSCSKIEDQENCDIKLAKECSIDSESKVDGLCQNEVEQELYVSDRIEQHSVCSNKTYGNHRFCNELEDESPFQNDIAIQHIVVNIEPCTNESQTMTEEEFTNRGKISNKQSFQNDSADGYSVNTFPGRTLSSFNKSKVESIVCNADKLQYSPQDETRETCKKLELGLHDIKLTEQFSIDSNNTLQELCQNEPTNKYTISACIEGTLPCQNEPDKEELLACDKEAQHKHVICDKLEDECLFQNNVVQHVTEANTLKTDSYENDSNEYKCKIMTEEMSVVSNGFCSKYSFQNVPVAGHNISAISERMIPFVNETDKSEIVNNTSELQNYSQDETEKPCNLDNGSKGEESFQKNATVVVVSNACIETTILSKNETESQSVECIKTRQQACYKNEPCQDYIANHQVVSTGDTKRITCNKESDKEKVMFDTHEGCQQNNSGEHNVQCKTDDKDENENNAEIENNVSAVVAELCLCQNGNRENTVCVNQDQQECSQSESVNENIFDNGPDIKTHHTLSTDVSCQSKTKNQTDTGNKSGEQQYSGREQGVEHDSFNGVVVANFLKNETVDRFVYCKTREQADCQIESKVQQVPHAVDAETTDKSSFDNNTVVQFTAGLVSEKQESYKAETVMEHFASTRTGHSNMVHEQLTQYSENGPDSVKHRPKNALKEGQCVDCSRFESDLKENVMADSERLKDGKNENTPEVNSSCRSLEVPQCESKETSGSASYGRTKINANEELETLQLHKLNDCCADGELIVERPSSSNAVNTNELIEDNHHFLKENCNSKVFSLVENRSELIQQETSTEIVVLNDMESKKEVCDCNRETFSCDLLFETKVEEMSDDEISHNTTTCNHITPSVKENIDKTIDTLHFSEAFENSLNDVQWETAVEAGKLASVEVQPVCSPLCPLKTNTVCLQEDLSSGDLEIPEENFQLQRKEENVHGILPNLNPGADKESTSSKRYRTRQILESFFMPNQHQRYLDVIVEEGGDCNEKEMTEQNNFQNPQSRTSIAGPNKGIDVANCYNKLVKSSTSQTFSNFEQSEKICTSLNYGKNISDKNFSQNNRDDLTETKYNHWEKNSSKSSKHFIYPLHKTGFQVELENIDEDDVILSRGRMQEMEENAEVVFLEDTSSASSVTIQGDDPGDDADIEEVGFDFQDGVLGGKARTLNPISHHSFNHRLSGIDDVRNKMGNQFIVYRETNAPKSTKYYDEPIYENVIIRRNADESKDCKVISSVTNFNSSSTKPVKLNENACDFIGESVAWPSVRGSDFNVASKTSDDSMIEGNHNEKIVNFFKHLFVSLPESDARRVNVHDALSELVNDPSSPLSPSTRSSLDVFLSDETFNTIHETDTNKDNLHAVQCPSSISPRNYDCSSTNTNMNPIESSDLQTSCYSGSSNCETGSNVPRSLKDLASDRILSLPYGTEILICLGIKGIHMYSQLISAGRGETYNSRMPDSPTLPHIFDLSEGLSVGQSIENNQSDVINTPIHFFDQEPYAPVIPNSYNQDWVGMPTSMDPRLLVCMSPSQARGYRGHYMLPTPEEAQSLLDLHNKYLERHCCHDKSSLPRHSQTLVSPQSEDASDIHDSSHRKQSDSEFAFIVNSSREKECVTSHAVKIPAEEGESARAGKTESSRLLAIIRESSPRRVPSCQQTSAGMEPLYANEVRTANRHSWAGQHLDRPADKRASAFLDSLDRNLRVSDDDRLKTNLLSEWMSLARERSGCSSSLLRNKRQEETETRSSLKENGHVVTTQAAVKEEAQSVSQSVEDKQVSVGNRRHSLPGVVDQGHHQPQLARQVSVPCEPRRFDPEQYIISKRGDIAIIQSEARPGKERPRAATGGDGEIFRQQMYLEYMSKVEERKERRRQKVIRISAPPLLTEADQNCPRLQSEFMDRVRERMDKLGLDYCDEENHAVPPQLPSHLHEFLASDDAASDAEGVWSPAQKDKDKEPQPEADSKPAVSQAGESTQAPLVWTPKSAGSSPVADRKEFRPIKFQSPTLPRKNTQPPEDQMKQEESRPQQQQQIATEVPEVTSSSDLPSTRLVQSHSAPASGLSSLVSLPRAQNPTITLLQKAREGQLPKGAHYLENSANNNEDKSDMNPNDILFKVKREYETDTEEGHKKVTELTPKKYDGIGPITKEGIPLVLRSEIRDANQAKWYKRMYDSLHRSSKDDDYVTVRYRPSRGGFQPPYASAGGYMSEPDRTGYHSDVGYSAKYATLDRRRIKNKENDFTTNTLPRSKYLPHPNSIKYYPEVYRNQPGRIEDYVPGRSSISDKETKQWWDEVLEIFDGDKQYSNTVPVNLPGNSFLNRAAKVSGYESDSTLVFKRRDENLQNQLSPAEQKIAYKTIQKGGEVPLHGLRKPAPERPKESPHRYVESEVTIHYRSPVRSEAKQAVSEEELARQQAEAMRRIYQEERRRKYLQELQDMNSRRHTDNFTPSQKSPIPLNRYDDILDDVSKTKPRDRTPEPKLVARALYNFVGQTSRELSFRRGDIIFVKRQIDKNWYEGEHNAMVGLFPLNYVEIIPYDGIRTMPKRASEGQARAKFNFTAQTYLELPLVKGELVVLTRRVDDNWYEGRIGTRKGIFPVSYVEVLQEPGVGDRPAPRAVSAPAQQLVMVNGSRSSRPVTYQPVSYYSHNKPLTGHYATLPRQILVGKQPLSTMNQVLHIDTLSEPVPYRALYNYCPQNDDELELIEGDMVYVMEKCDDGWYVGSSQRTGYFGTFPGNYVERI